MRIDKGRRPDDHMELMLDMVSNNIRTILLSSTIWSKYRFAMANQYLPPVIQIPSMLLITDISRSSPMMVTFIVPQSGSNTYIPGQVVRLLIPRTWGMFQANGLLGKILQVGASTMLLNIDSSLFDAFVYAPNSGETPASLSPYGSQNLEFSNLTNDVPFQSLNNIGN